MFIALLLAFCQGKGTIDQKFTVFAKGAANENVLTMLMIYILGRRLLHPWPVPWAAWTPP